MKKFARFTAVACSVLTLASCAKTCTFAEAKEVAKAYTSETGFSSCEMKTVMNIKKSSGIFANVFEVGKTEDTQNSPVTPLNEAAVITIGDKVNWKLDGTALSYTYTMTTEDFKEEYPQFANLKGFEAKGKSSAEFDSKGLSKKIYEYIYMKINASGSGISVSGEVEIESVATYTYSK